MTTLLLELALPATVCLAAAVLLERVLHRRSAAFRAQAWLIGFAAILFWIAARIAVPSLALHLPLLPPGQVITGKWEQIETPQQPLAGVFGGSAANWGGAARSDRYDHVLPQYTGFVAGQPFLLYERRQFRSDPDSERVTVSVDSGHLTVKKGFGDVPVAAPLPHPAVWELVRNWVASLSWESVLVGVWLAGVTALFARILLGTVALQNFLRAKRDVTPGSVLDRAMRHAVSANTNIRVGVHPHVDSPISFGVTTCWILFPPECDQPAYDEASPEKASCWSESRIALVAAHEVAHCVRRDYLSVLLIRLIVALCWFHPLAWWGLARFRLLCEMAADDRALLTIISSRNAENPASGSAAQATDIEHDAIAYAAELVALTKALRPLPPRLQSAVLSVGGASSLRSRIVALLDSGMERRALRFREAFAMAVIALAAAVLLPAVRVVQAAPEPEPAQAVAPPATIVPVELEAPASKEFVLTVLDEEGVPLSGVKVKAEASHYYQFLTTAADGKATFSLPDKLEDSLELEVSRAGYVTTSLTWTMAKPEDAVPKAYKLTLMEGVTIGGVVQDEQGKPVKDARVVLYVYPKNKQKDADTEPGQPRISTTVWEQRCRTDKDGRWTYEGAPSSIDNIRAELEHPDFISNEPFEKMPAIEEFEEQKAVFTALRGQPVEGVVLGPDGKPVAGATVCLGEAGADSSSTPSRETDEQGKFRFGGVKMGAYPAPVVTVFADGLAPEMVNLEKGVTQLEIRLTKGKTLRVKIVDKQGQPVPGVFLAPWMWRGHRPFKMAFYSEKDGTITWEHAPEDSVHYVMEKAKLAGRNIDLAPGNEELQTVTIGPRTVASGRVIDALTKRPIPAFTFMKGTSYGDSENKHTNWSDKAVEGTDGIFQWEGPDRRAEMPKNGNKTFSYGVHLLRLEAPGYEPVISRSIQHDEGPITLDFELKSTRPIRGIVTTADGRPVKGAIVAVAWKGDPVVIEDGTLSRRSDLSIEGAVTNERGEYTLRAQDKDYQVAVVAPDAGYVLTTFNKLWNAPNISLLPWGQVDVLGRPPLPDGRSRYALVNPEAEDAQNPEIQTSRRIRFETTKPVFSDDGHTIFQHVIAGPIKVRTLALGRDYGPEVQVENGKVTTVDLLKNKHRMKGRMEIPEGSSNDATQCRFQLIIDNPPLDIPAYLQGMERVKWVEKWKLTPEGKRITAGNLYTRLKLDASGAFEVEELPAGRYRLSGLFLKAASVPGGSPSYEIAGELPETTVVVDASREVTDIGTLKTTPRKKIKGAVKSADGKPAPGARIIVLMEMNRPLRVVGGVVQQLEDYTYVLTNKQGEFVLEDVSENNLPVAIVHPELGYMELKLNDLRKAPEVKLSAWGKVAVKTKAGDKMNARYSVTSSDFIATDGNTGVVYVGQNPVQSYSKQQARISFEAGGPTVAGDGVLTFSHLTAGLINLSLVGSMPPVVFADKGDGSQPVETSVTWNGSNRLVQVVQVNSGETTQVDRVIGLHTLTGKIKVPPLPAGNMIAKRWRFTLVANGLQKAIPPGLTADELEVWRKQWRDTPAGRAARVQAGIRVEFQPDADGVFRVEELPPGHYLLSCSDPLLYETQSGGTQEVLKDKEIEISSDKDVTDVGAITPQQQK